MRSVRSLAARLGPLLWLTVTVGPVAWPQEYTIGAGDELMIRVMRHPELSVDSIQVSEQGMISLPVVGELRVQGLTLQQATEEITQRLRVRLLNPEVSIIVLQVRPDKVYVLGRVAAPGVYPLRPGMRLTELIAAAGGLTGLEEKSAGTLLRADGSMIEVDIEAAIANGDSAANIVILPGDVLNVTRRAIMVTVTGAVLQPGTYAVPVDANFIEVLARAGGVSPRARLSSVVLERADGERTTFDLSATVLDGAPAPAVTFADGDIVAVPVEMGLISVFGSVANPGSYRLSEDRVLRISDAIAKAGGLGPRPDKVDAYLFRRNGETIKIDLAAILLQGSAEANLVLQDGDIISVIGRTVNVQVLGEVTTPGTYTLPDGAGVLQAIAAAGGVTGRAALNRVSVRHADGSTSTVDVLQAFLGEGDITDIRLQEQDVVILHEERAAVVVLGAVASPGFLSINEYDPPTVTEMLARAGGPRKGARLSRVAVVRGDPANPQRLTVDVDRVVRGDPGADLVVQPRDVIYVPERTLDWDIVFRSISAISLLGNWLSNINP